MLSSRSASTPTAAPFGHQASPSPDCESLTVPAVAPARVGRAATNEDRCAATYELQLVIADAIICSCLRISDASVDSASRTCLMTASAVSPLNCVFGGSSGAAAATTWDAAPTAVRAMIAVPPV